MHFQGLKKAITCLRSTPQAKSAVLKSGCVVLGGPSPTFRSRLIYPNSNPKDRSASSRGDGWLPWEVQECSSMQMKTLIQLSRRLHGITAVRRTGTTYFVYPK